MEAVETGSEASDKADAEAETSEAAVAAVVMEVAAKGAATEAEAMEAVSMEAAGTEAAGSAVLQGAGRGAACIPPIQQRHTHQHRDCMLWDPWHTLESVRNPTTRCWIVCR